MYRKSNALTCYMCKFAGLALEINVFLLYRNVAKILLMTLKFNSRWKNLQ